MASLNLDQLRALASRYGYEEVQFNEVSRVVAFRKAESRVNVYYTTRTVATCLEHPFSGKSQLCRRNCSLEDIEKIFDNPRIHTGKGYYRRDQCHAWTVEDSPIKQQGNGAAPKRRKVTRDESDEARRWRFIQASTDFCTVPQINQVVAFWKLYNDLRYCPGGPTDREFLAVRADRLPERLRNACCENPECPRCTERAGFSCNFFKILFQLLTELHSTPVAIQEKEESEEILTLTAEMWKACACEEGAAFYQQNHERLGKMERQLRSMPSHVRREIIFWILSRHLPSATLVKITPATVDGPDVEAAPLSDSCNPAIAASHFEYGELFYPEDFNGCNCHGK